MKIPLPHYLDDVSKPAAEEYLVKIQEGFYHQIWSPRVPLTPISGISKAMDGVAFASIGPSAQIIVGDDLSNRATAADVLPAMMAIEASSPFDNSL